MNKAKVCVDNLIQNKIEYEEDLYIFLHIPKCGGTTIHHHIINNLSKHQYLELVDETFESKERIEQFICSLSESERKKIKVVFGHNVYYGIHKLFGREGKYITFLRNPVDRTISQYNYQKMILLRGKEDITSFEEWILNGGQYMNVITGFLSKRLLQLNDYNETDFEKIKTILDKFYFVGLVENDEDFLYLYYILGIDKFILRQNVSKKFFIPEDYVKTMRFINKKIEHDKILYDYLLNLNNKFKRNNKDFDNIVNFMKQNQKNRILIDSTTYLMRNFLYNIYSGTYLRFMEFIREHRRYND